MSWKNWSYTKKGAIIGFIIGLFALLHFGFLLGFCFQDCPKWIALTQWLNPATYIFRLLLFSDAIAYPSFLFMPILGAIIGWIIGKIRSKKSE